MQKSREMYRRWPHLPYIAEKGATDSQIGTVLKVLYALDKTLKIVPIENK